jgi:general secretion pathway protein K
MAKLKLLISNPFGLNNSKGVALLQAMFMVMLITFIVNQVNFEAAVEYSVNAQSLHRVRAYQAARAGLELSLLRIKIYQRLMNGEAGVPKEQIGSIAKMIYSIPVSWPMTLPSDLSAVDKDGFEKLNKESLMESTYSTQIQSEDLLNINDLASPIQSQRDRIKNKLKDLFESKMENDKDWAEQNRGIAFEEVINNIQDWIDSDTESGNGGNERDIYGKLRELDPDNRDNFPPNRYFRSMDELHMVPGVTDEIFEIIKTSFSVFGPMGINPNYAEADTIKALHKSLTDEIVAKVLQRRNDPEEGGPFTSEDDFFDFVNSKGARIGDESKEIPLRFTEPCNFRIQSTGASGKTVSTITAITYDFSCATETVSKKLNSTEGGGQGGGNGTGGQPNDQGSRQSLPKGPPRIVYWNEK